MATIIYRERPDAQQKAAARPPHELLTAVALASAQQKADELVRALGRRKGAGHSRR
jgi:hypothetical protein